MDALVRCCASRKLSLFPIILMEFRLTARLQWPFAGYFTIDDQKKHAFNLRECLINHVVC